METTTLGRGGPVVSRAGLGLMAMSGVYGQADDQESIATIHAAVDAGITLLDTGDFYGMGHNELLLRDALRRGIPRDRVFIQVKFGGQRDPSGAFVGHDASPSAVKSSLAYTLTRLGTSATSACRRWARTPSAGQVQAPVVSDLSGGSRRRPIVR